MIEIDGAYGEGGGQIVRTACALAARTQRPCHIVNIRRGRKVPGLRLQHVLAVRVLRELCGGWLKGDLVGSRELSFYPGTAVAKDARIDIGTAASIPLIAQCLIPYLISASDRVRLSFTGGATDTAFAPPYDYFRQVFLWFLQQTGVEVKAEASRRGFYPVGGAQATIEAKPAKPKPLNLAERGSLLEIRVLSAASTILKRRKVAERQIEGALRRLSSMRFAPKATIEYAPSMSAGSALCIVGEFERTVLGTTALGARGKMAEQVGLEAAEEYLIEFNSNACLDDHMADQILPYMALAGKEGFVTVGKNTDHCRTNMWVIEQFIEGKFDARPGSIRWIPATAKGAFKA